MPRTTNRIQREANTNPTRKRGAQADRFATREAIDNRVALRRKVTTPPSTVNQASRTIDATIVTTTPVRIYDWSTDEYVDEVLLPSGMTPNPAGVQLRRQHYRYDPTDVLGSVGNIRAGDDEAVATLEFSSAPDVEPLFVRVKEGHLRGVSVGGQYETQRYTQIAAGKKATVAGREWTAAPDAPLRIVEEWMLDEVSVVVRGADANALTRSGKPRIRTRSTNGQKQENQQRGNGTATRNGADHQQGQTPGTEAMKLSKRAINYLRTLGLAANATMAAAVTFARGLTPDQLEGLYTESPQSQRVIEAQRADDPSDDDDSDDEEFETAGGTATATRTARRSANTATRSTTNTATRSTANTATRERVQDGDELPNDNPLTDTDRESLLRADRQRQAAIRRMATADIPADLVERACEEGWTEDQAGRRFYQHVQRQARPAIGNGDNRERGPAVHRTAGPTIEALQAAVLMRQGFNLENEHFRTEQAQSIFERANLGWLARFNRELDDRGNSSAERIVETGRRYRHDHAMRTLERMMEAQGRRVPTDPDTLVERSFGGSYLPRVFGAILSVGVVVGFMEYQDSTRGWVSEADWNDFRDNQPIGLDAKSSLKKHVRNTQAKTIELGDFGDKYAVNRFCGVFQLDDMDFTDDLISANQQIPRELGKMAASLRPDLIYAVMQSNPTLLDGTALFHASRGNLLTSTAFGLTGLTAAEAAMALQTVTDASGKAKARNLMMGHLVVPRSLRMSAKQATKSARVVSSTTQGDTNPHDGEYSLHSDARLDVGVTDPRTEATVAGSATRWFGGEQGGQHGLQVGYRRGTGRAPQIRGQRNTTPGVWGYCWDVAMDIGVGVVSPVGLIRCDA